MEGACRTMEDYVTILLRISELNQEHDLYIPNDITAKELLEAIVYGYGLKTDMEDISNCYLIAENPAVLLKGNEKLSDSGIHNGTIINLMN